MELKNATRASDSIKLIASRFATYVYEANRAMLQAHFNASMEALTTLPLWNEKTQLTPEK